MTGFPRSLLQVVGSLWIAVVLLVLMMLAMGCATVFESTFGTERALQSFYLSVWFKLLLALLCLNILAAVLARFPWQRFKIGFLLTHAGILVILAGALITDLRGVHGEMTIAEGQTITHFNVERATLSVSNESGQTRTAIALPEELWKGFVAIDRPSLDPIPLGTNGQARIVRYVPDMLLERSVLNDNPSPAFALELLLSSEENSETVWLLDGHEVLLGGRAAAFRLVQDNSELRRLIPELMEEDTDSRGVARILLDGSRYELRVDECMEQAMPIGDTGLSLRVIRYLPHAVLGRDKNVTNASEQAMNPAIEVELLGQEESETLVLFARFPEFNAEHRLAGDRNIQLTYDAPSILAPRVPIEFLQGPEESLFVRIRWAGAKMVTSRIELGKEIDTPWPGEKLIVQRRFDHARINQSAVEPEVVRKNRRPALLLELSQEGSSEDLWIQKYQLREVSVAGESFQLVYSDGAEPLRFGVRLDRFRLGTYPGGEKPRSFESRISFKDSAAATEEPRVVSMNNPTSFGGYTFYQQSYRQIGDRMATILRISKDPGQPVVFAGYILTVLGMLVVLVTRAREKRHPVAAPGP